jgi:predicted Fe-Mo cluster-binding NifX family protein
MKLCIPTKDDRGSEAEPFGHFGSAPFFTLVDTDTGEIEVVPNSNPHHRHGTCHPMSQLRDRELDAIVCRGIGRRAFASLESEGIQVMVASEGNVADILVAIREGALLPLTAEEACHGRHGHGHGHGHHHRHRHEHRHGKRHARDR